MAAIGALTAHVHISIGDGPPTEVGTFPIPLLAALAREADPSGVPGAYIEVDHVRMHEGMRVALVELATAIPNPPDRPWGNGDADVLRAAHDVADSPSWSALRERVLDRVRANREGASNG